MKKYVALMMAAALSMSVIGCASNSDETKAAESTVEETKAEPAKKALPVKQEEAASETEAPLYKDIMKPYTEIEHGNRLIILQNTLAFSREGIITEEEKAVAETVSYNETDYNGYAMTNAVQHLTKDLTGEVTVYTTDGASSTVAAEEFEAMTVLIDDFQSGNSPILYHAENGTAIENFDYAVLESGEGIFSIITEEEVNVTELLTDYGWDTTKTYNLVATDVFYIPITPEDYDEGGLRGALSGAINANFPDMIIATGKLNDVVFIEEIVE